MQIQRLGDEAWSTATGWRWMFAPLAAPSVLFAACLFAFTESPRWLMKTGRREPARPILAIIGGAENAGREIARIEAALRQEQGRWSELSTTG
ncbi:MAG: MFS transporter [Acidobacteriia bacterium]|nr:MFS transporter [Terriglobia bacterium]